MREGDVRRWRITDEVRTDGIGVPEIDEEILALAGADDTRLSELGADESLGPDVAIGAPSPRKRVPIEEDARFGDWRGPFI